MAREKTRIALELTPEAAKQLDDLKERAGVATRAELIRNALKLYAWFVEQEKQGCEVAVRDPAHGDERIVQLFL